MRNWIAGIVMALGTTAQAEISSSLGPLSVEPIVSGLNAPWAFGFLPNGNIVITERAGRLLIASDSGVKTVSGVPDVVDDGQGGLLDILVPRDFVTTRDIYMTFAKRQERGSGTALARAQLSNDGTTLINTTTIFEIAEGSGGGRHFGSRLVEGQDGKIYMTVGDRGDRPSAQDLSRENGSVLRLNRDGSIPADNPFEGSAIWSYGHRNPQGLTMDVNGQIWGIEHGARGGDEVNQIAKGANFGWPVIAYGRHYSGGKIGEGAAKDGMEQPAHYWDPSIAPSGATIVSGPVFADWAGDMFTGSLKFDSLHRLDMRNGVREVEVLQSKETNRVRDVRIGPKGGIWFLSEGNGALYKMTP